MKKKWRGAVPWTEVKKSNLLHLSTNTGTKRQEKNTHTHKPWNGNNSGCLSSFLLFIRQHQEVYGFFTLLPPFPSLLHRKREGCVWQFFVATVQHLCPLSYSNWPGVWRWESKQDFNFSLNLFSYQLFLLNNLVQLEEMASRSMKVCSLIPKFNQLAHTFLWVPAFYPTFECVHMEELETLLPFDVVGPHVVQTCTNLSFSSIPLP